MKLSKNLLFGAALFAVSLFLIGLLIDWMKGDELGYARRFIFTVIATPIYIAIKIWQGKRRSKTPNA